MNRHQQPTGSPALPAAQPLRPAATLPSAAHPRSGGQVERVVVDRDEPWLPGESGEILLVTAFDFLRNEVGRIVAAAGGQLRCVDDAVQASPYWDSAEAVLVGSDVRELPPRRRAPAVLVGTSGEGDGLWHLAASLGAERVAVLPDAAGWLAEHLARSRSPEAGGLVIGVTGGCGGAGASTAAIWLAQAAAGLGASALLIDGDPWGGGLELALAAEESAGLRWPDLAEASGSIDSEQLKQSLPVAGGFSFLSWPGSRDRPAVIPGETLAGVLDAARRGFEVVVVDVGRAPEQFQQFAWDCDRILIVIPPQLKAAVAAARLVQELPPVETGMLVRGRARTALDAAMVSEAVRLPIHGYIPEVRGTAAATEAGGLLDLGKRRSVRRFAVGVLDAVDDVLYPADLA
ncbi:septum site-determining protein Ssd [Pseudarthrobacter sp. J64]|uniref:septum site-determining protein Ssd n=1 Tax=Pseudarthrobacter sp. J64 TaxID=3116485 RepID=UPI002E820704|nr:septum site-determining protein Ssd [Pseudarthrobacter sp. J64]MEE2567785.1 septum site-determining protein Ssd [Pseudarthrobacter sp. J64]